MTPSIRQAIALLLLVSIATIVGCSKKDEGQPNSELTVPDVPPVNSKDGKKGPEGGPKFQ